MKYLLDTTICIHFLRRKFGLIEKFENTGIENFAIPEITFTEMIFGAENSRSNGTMISDYGLLIGCTSVEKSLIMVTENLKEFERISGIRIENWIKR